MRVALCTPSLDTVKTGFCYSLASLVMVSCRDHELMFLNERLSDIAKSRNALVARAKSAKCDYLLWLDSDIVCPPTTLLRLISYRRDIVGCTYEMRSDQLGAVDTGIQGDTAGGLRQVEQLPGGALLVSMEVYASRANQWYQNTDAVPEDFYFCQWAQLRGFKVWLDFVLSTQLQHLGEKAYVLNGQKGSERA